MKNTKSFIIDDSLIKQMGNSPITGDSVINYMASSLLLNSKKQGDIVGFTVRLPKDTLNRIDDLANSFGFTRNWVVSHLIYIGLSSVEKAIKLSKYSK